MQKQITMQDLLSNKFKYRSGSTTIGNIDKHTKEWINEQLMDIFKHYGMDWEFFYNWLDDKSLRKEYRESFEKMVKYLLSPSKIDSTLKKFFYLEVGRWDSVVRWKLNDKESKKFLLKFMESKAVSDKIKEEYQAYLEYDDD